MSIAYFGAELVRKQSVDYFRDEYSHQLKNAEHNMPTRLDTLSDALKRQLRRQEISFDSFKAQTDMNQYLADFPETESLALINQNPGTRVSTDDVLVYVSRSKLNPSEETFAEFDKLIKRNQTNWLLTTDNESWFLAE